MKLREGDEIFLEGGIGVVCLDCNDRVYFRWENGDLCWVYRRNILRHRRKFSINKKDVSEIQLDITEWAKEIRKQKILELKALIAEKQAEYDNLSLAKLLNENKIVEKCVLAIKLINLKEKLNFLLNL
jgi:hypothetical protein